MDFRCTQTEMRKIRPSSHHLEEKNVSSELQNIGFTVGRVERLVCYKVKGKMKKFMSHFGFKGMKEDM